MKKAGVIYYGDMSNAMLEKRVRALENRVRSLQSLVKRDASITGLKKAKKLPRGLQIALREVEEGKLSGPFSTVEEFMAHLTKK
jgi:hypothetical protein